MLLSPVHSSVDQFINPFVILFSPCTGLSQKYKPLFFLLSSLTHSINQSFIQSTTGTNVHSNSLHLPFFAIIWPETRAPELSDHFTSITSYCITLPFSIDPYFPNYIISNQHFYKLPPCNSLVLRLHTTTTTTIVTTRQDKTFPDPDLHKATRYNTTIRPGSTYLGSHYYITANQSP